MSSRKPGYLIGVMLLALVMSVPQLVLSFAIGIRSYQMREWPSMRIPFFGGTEYYFNQLTYATFWQDQFIQVKSSGHRSNGIRDWTVSAIDSETGKTTDLGLRLSGRSGFQSMAFGDRLWFFENLWSVQNGPSFELVDGVLKSSLFVPPRAGQQGGQEFLLNGEAACVERVPNPQRLTVSTFQAGTWGNAGDVVLPSNQRDWRFGKTPVNFQRSQWMTCLNQGDHIHVFLDVDGRLLHREGLELKRVGAPDELSNKRFKKSMGSTDESVSALKVLSPARNVRSCRVFRPTPPADRASPSTCLDCQP